MTRKLVWCSLYLVALVGFTGNARAQDMTFTTEETSTGQAPPPAEGPPSEALANALRLYQSERYAEAAVQFQRVVEGETGDAPANVQKAQFFLGKCLYHLRYYQSALAVFDEIVQQGQAHTYFPATLQWLAQLARELPEPAGIIERVGRYGAGELNQFNTPETKDLYNQLLYLLGRFKYGAGEFAEAIRLFDQVDRHSVYFVQAKFFAGITHVRERRAQPAARAFRDIIEAVDEGVEGIEDEQRMIDLGWLSLARIYYSTRHFASAVEAWNRVEVNSEYWLDGLFEESWAYFMTDNFDRALGNIHTLNSPYFPQAYYPESIVLKSVIYFAHCQYDNAQTTVDEFNSKYEPLKREIEGYLQQYQDNNAFFEFLKKVRAGEANLPPRVRPIIENALGDRTLLRNIEYVRVLDDEERRLNGAPGEFRSSSLGARILQDISVARSLAVDAAGDLARGRYQRLLEELQDLMNQATSIQIEILNAQRGQLTQEMQQGQVSAGPSRVENRITADEEHVLWPFNGEYWRDELGYYRQAITSQCGR
ncbi:MAG: hypothetical protein HYY06_14555 [Deltaproteobacteria bacterium]|nr:hypothetical protein [Deltaproteobacteria bacterium]